MLSRAFTLIGAFALACSTADDRPSVTNGSGAMGAGGPAGMGMSGVGTGGAAGSSGAGGALGGEHTGGAAAGTPRGGGGAISAGGRPTAGGGNAQGGKGDGGRNAAGGKGDGAGNTAGGNTGGNGNAAGGEGGTGGTTGGKGGSGGNAGAVTNAGGSGATANVTVWLAGDSTMANGETPCPVGWGKVFKPYFNDRVTITNSAVGGASIRTWLYDVGTTMDASGECVLTTDSSGQPTPQTRWTQMLAGMKAGDYLIVQFGINDGDPSCNRHVGLDAFKASLGVMAQAAKARDTTAIFVTPVSGSTAKGTRGSYVAATLDAAAANGVPVIDLHALSVALYTASGFCPIPGGDVSASTTGPVGDFFCDDHTHFETAGATTIAGLVAQALRDQNIALAAYLK